MRKRQYSPVLEYKRTVKKFHKKYEEISKLTKSGSIETIGQREKERLFHRLRVLFNRIKNLHLRFGLKLAGAAFSFSLIVTSINAQAPFNRVDELNQPLGKKGPFHDASYNVGIRNTFVDLDHDGDLDMFTGGISNDIAFYKNMLIESGNDSLYFEIEEGVYNPLDTFQFAKYQGGGGPPALYSPAFADLDKDGDMDLFIVSDKYGAMEHYINMEVESGNDSAYFLQGDTNIVYGINLGMWAKPSFVDLDGDGDLDLVGTNSPMGPFPGQLMHYKNMQVEDPNDSIYFVPQVIDTIFTDLDLKMLSNTSFADYDSDGDLDMLAGSFYDKVRLFKNMQIEDANDSVYFIEVPENQHELKNCFGYGLNDPNYLDIDEDGDHDLVLGAFFSTVFYKNNGTDADPDFETIQIGAEIPSIEFADIDNDGDLDFFVGNNGLNYMGDPDLVVTNLRFYENESTVDDIIFNQVKENNPFDSIVALGDFPVTPEFVDFDDDGDIDMFLNYYYDSIYYYRNNLVESGNTAVSFTRDPGPDSVFYKLADFSAYMHNKQFSDLDLDGDLDLIVNGDNNSIEVFKNMDIEDPKDSIYFVQLAASENPLDSYNPDVFKLVDIDDDGDDDLFYTDGYDLFFAVNQQQETHKDTVFFTERTGAFNLFDTVSLIFNSGFGPSNISSFTFVDSDGDNDLDLWFSSTKGVVSRFINENNAPTLENPIDMVIFDTSELISWQIPDSTFADDAYDTLLFQAEIIGTDTLPSWLGFTQEGGIFAGTSPDSQVVYTIGVTGFDLLNYSASDTFTFVVNEVPYMHEEDSLVDQSILMGEPFMYTFGDTLFMDVPSDSVSFTTKLADGSDLPGWLSFEVTGDRTFSGAADVADTIDVVVYAEDKYMGVATDTFSLISLNRIPVVVNGIADYPTSVGLEMSYQIPVNAFSDPLDSLGYTATLDDGSALPAWLSFETVDPRTFTGTPAAEDTFSIVVTVEDKYGETVTDTFNIIAGQNDTPTLDNPIVDQQDTVNNAFNFVVPANTFSDPEGNPLTLSANQANGSALPAWLSFDGASGTFSGTPANTDSIDVTVIATDDYNASASDTFTIKIVEEYIPPVVDVDENVLSTGFDVYPNPATEFVTLRMNESHKYAHIILTDMSGKMIKQEYVRNIEPGQEIEINVQGIQSGMFVLTVSTELKVNNTTIVIE